MRLLLQSLLILCWWLSSMVSAAQFQAADDATLQRLLQQANSGDEIVLQGGRYRGPLMIDKAIQLRGVVGASPAIIDSGGAGHGLEIRSPRVVIANLQIENWGRDLGQLHAGIFIHKQASASRIIHNRLQGIGFGIWVDAAADVEITANQIEGDDRVRSEDRGNGIHLFNVSGALVKDNEVWHSRDGIYIDSSNFNRLEGNLLRDLRYGVHYMYSHSNQVLGNITLRTRTGYALMQSKRLTVRDNLSYQDMNYGILMNFITDSDISGNQVFEVQSARTPQQQGGSKVLGGEGKALFVYNSLYNRIEGNLFARSDLGVHLTAGSEDNQLQGNAFIHNRTQVKYVSTRSQEWSVEGQGNYWSDYLGWDHNEDGLGDAYYEPNDGVDRLLWQYPSARMLFNSPAVLTLRWVQRQFPVFRPPGVRDSYPLMATPLAVMPIETLLQERGYGGR